MKIAILLTAAVAVLTIGTNRTHAQSAGAGGSCPDLNGHYNLSDFVARADVYVTQSGCDSMRVQMAAKVLGQNYNEDISSPLDGVTREVPSQSPNERDFVSGRWEGDTVVFVVRRDVTDASGNATSTTNMIAGHLSNADTLVADMSDVDTGGQPVNTKSYAFHRVN